MGIIQWFRGGGKEETRNTLRNPSWWKSAFSGSNTYTGMAVTPDSAMQQPAVFACVRVISEDVASLPIKIYSRISDMEREPIEGHPVSVLLRNRPNSEMTSFTFMETMTAHVLLYGNAYAEIERNGAGEPIGLWILLPENVILEIFEGSVQYRYQSGTKTAILKSENVLHIKGLGHDGLTGYSPIQYAKQTIGISAAMEEAGGTFFANSSRPSGVLEHPAKLSEEASKRLRQGWDGMYSGSGNVGKTAILEEGMQWSSLSIPNSDAQWLEARQYALQDIARIYRVPPHMVGDLSRATYSNIESQQIAYIQQTLLPWLRRWEQEINKKLIGSDDRSVYGEFLVEEMMRGNTIDRFAAYRTARESGWLSVNEIRKRENMNPIEGGDNFIQPLNFAEVSVASEMQSEESERKKDLTIEDRKEDVPIGWTHDSIRRCVSIINNTSNRKASRIDPVEWAAWIQSPDEKLTRKLEDILKPCCSDIGLQEKDVANELLLTWRSAVSSADTLEKSIESCNNWAKTFNQEESITILLDRSNEDE